MAENIEKRFREDIQYRIQRLKHFGKKHGWKLTNETSLLLEFDITHIDGNPKIYLKINYIDFGIETTLNHPKRGITKLNREGKFSMKLIEKVFVNPRVHMPQHIKAEYVKI